MILKGLWIFWKPVKQPLVRNFLAFTVLVIGIVSHSGLNAQVVKSRKTYLNICSFNVYLLGAVADRYKEIDDAADDSDFQRSDSSYFIPKRVYNCAEVLSKGHFELIVFQELVTGAPGDSVMADLAKVMNTKYKRNYKWFTSGNIGKGFRIYESMGFLYDSTKVDLIRQTDEKCSYLACDETKNRKYVKTCWRASNFDFTLISCHFAWNSSDPLRRQADYRKLNDILHHPQKYSHDPDVIVVGDFNRYGGGFSQSKKQFGIQQITYDSTKFRVPHVEVFDKKVVELKEAEDNESLENPQQYSTTVSNDNTVVYDLFWITSDVQEEYKMSANKWNRDFGVLVYDETWGNGYIEGTEHLSTAETKKLYSDHRPIWMRFKINTNNRD